MDIINKLLEVVLETETLHIQCNRILQLANEERLKLGLQQLKSNYQLQQLALMKAQDMVQNKYFSHQSPALGSPFDMMRSQGIYYLYAGENLAINQNADKAHHAWMASQEHKNNILHPLFTDIGVGIAPMGNGSYVYVQMFLCR